MTTWTGKEPGKPGFVIDQAGIGQGRRYRVRPRRRDGTLGASLAEHRRWSLAERVRRGCEDALQAGEEWALKLVDVSAGQLRSDR
ncbi:MAG TPA: hypothetical protein VFC09_09705 [Candidatus Dormibacteraeota bacterium]|nr:hypothetical protein [Candidatus Dormibacteraeota bacterium]